MNLIKKAALTLMILSIFILPAGGAGERSVQSPGFVPGSVPAGSGMAESMAPALHGMVLAMLNREASAFDPADRELAWESLYNMLSLYGQMDSRSVSEDGELLLPEETVRDYAAALDLDLDGLGSPPAAIRDRLNYDNVSHSYVVVCGEDGLAQVRVESFKPSAGGYTLTGSLVYQVDGRILAGFRAELRPQDNMFGYAVTAVSIAG